MYEKGITMLRKFACVLMVAFIVLFVHDHGRTVNFDTSGKIINIALNSAWTDTGIEVLSGEEYLIVAFGVYETGGDVFPCEMKNHHNPWGTGLNGGPYNMSQYAVVARIGVSDTFYVGPRRAFHADCQGTLYIGINDNIFSDNSGVLTAMIFKLVPTFPSAAELPDAPGGPELRQNYPNPFNPATTISYDLQRPGHVRLSIFNVAGQRVATPVDDYQEAGNHRFVWNARSDDGRRVASGTYLYRLDVNGKQTAKKAILLK